MKLLSGLVAMSVCLAVAGRASAQYAGPPQSFGPRSYYPFPNGSVVTPYLDVSRGLRNNPAVGYFLGTRPEQQRRANDLFYQSSIQNLDRRVFGGTGTGEEEDITPVRGTGTPTAFMNTGGYFPASPFGVQGRPASPLQGFSQQRPRPKGR